MVTVHNMVNVGYRAASVGVLIGLDSDGRTLLKLSQVDIHSVTGLEEMTGMRLGIGMRTPALCFCV